MSVYLTRRNSDFPRSHITHCFSIDYAQTNLRIETCLSCCPLVNVPYPAANLLPLLVRAALLLNCRFPCVWMSLTTISLASKLRSVPLSVARPQGSCV